MKNTKHTQQDELVFELFNHLEEKCRMAIMKNDKPEAPIRERYVRLCSNLLLYFLMSPEEFRFFDRYCSSPYGIAKAKETFCPETCADNKYDPLKNLLKLGKTKLIFKDYSLSLLEAFTVGPIVLLLRAHHAGLIKLDEVTIRQVVESCWDALER